MRPTSILALILLAFLLAGPALGAPDDEPRPIVQASEILAKIERGEPVEYDGVIVEGDLDLSEVDLPIESVVKKRNYYEGEICWSLAREAKIINSLISITNSEIRGDVYLSNAIFQELVNFGGTNFTGEAWFSEGNFSGSYDLSGVDADFGGIQIIYTDLDGSACFKDAKFSGGIANFRGAEFSGGVANFWGAEFSGGVANFWRAEFSGGDADFGLAVFSGGDADFEEAVFSGGDTNFWRAEFSGGGAYFGETKFSGGDANFGKAVFSGGGAYFGETKFSGGDAEFSGAVFSDNANFKGTKFSGIIIREKKLIFSETESIIRMRRFRGVSGAHQLVFSRSFEICLGCAYFGEAEFSGGNAYFRGVQFSGGDAYFNGAEFGKDVYFEFSSFDHANLTLENSKNIRILRLSNSTFRNESTICLNGSDYERLYVHWDQIKDGFVYNGEVYLTLVKNFRNIEYFEDADGCYYQYRREKQSMRNWREVAKYIDILAWLTCGYGVRPGYTLAWSFVLITIFGIAFWAGNGIHRIAMPYQENAHEGGGNRWSISSICCLPFNKILNILRRILGAPKTLKKIPGTLLKIRPSTLRRLLGRILNASFVTDLSFKDTLYFSTMVFVSQPPHDWRPKEGWKYAVMLEDVLGWLLLALFLVTLGNVMIR